MTEITPPAKPLPVQPTPIKTAPEPKPKPVTPAPAPKQPEPKSIPKELQIVLNAMEDIEGILYAAREQIYQLYGPRDYSNISDIELRFSEQQASKLSFELVDNNWIIKPKQFLCQETFQAINTRVREIGGEYVAATQNTPGYFKVKRS